MYIIQVSIIHLYFMNRILQWREWLITMLTLTHCIRVIVHGIFEYISLLYFTINENAIHRNKDIILFQQITHFVFKSILFIQHLYTWKKNVIDSRINYIINIIIDSIFPMIIGLQFYFLLIHDFYDLFPFIIMLSFTLLWISCY